MLRVLALLTLLLTLALRTAPAIAGPSLADELETCRNRQADVGVRARACENLLAGGQLAGKDLAIALSGRGAALMAKRDYDKAIATFSEQMKADPEEPAAFIARGWAYVQKGDDDHAMEDFNQALKLRPSAPLALNNRGTVYLRQGAVQNALDDFNAALKSNPNLFFARMNRREDLVSNRQVAEVLYRSTLEEIRRAIGNDSFEHWWSMDPV